jgi:hypothetical protein
VGGKACQAWLLQFEEKKWHKFFSNLENEARASNFRGFSAIFQELAILTAQNAIFQKNLSENVYQRFWEVLQR